MTLLCGGNSATWGFTARCQAAAEVFGPAMMVWLASAGPQDAARYPTCLHFLRLDNWTTGEAPAAYVQRQTARIQPWHTAIPNLILIPGNESDREAGHGGESIQQYADALRAAFPGVKVSNVPLTVANTANATYAGCDVAVVHSYFERQHPETMGDPLFGRSYQHARASGLPSYVTEFNVVQTNCPIDWPDRNVQAAAWLDQAEGDGVAGAAFFILDAAPDWASYDVGPEAAADILAHRKGVTPVVSGYSGASNPRHLVPAHPGWAAALALHNQTDAAAIVFAYDAFSPTVGYNADLALAQACHETGWFTSPAWVSRRNPAGLGITGNNVAGPNFGTIERGVQAHLALLNCYYGDGKDPWGVLTSFGMGGMTLGKTTLSGMNGVWAVPGDGYGDAIAAIANQVIGGVAPPAPPPVTTGVTGDDIIDKARQYIGQQMSDGTLDSWNPPHPWGGYCEAFTEGVPFVLGLTVVHRGSALQKLQAVTEQGMLETSWPPEHGGCCLYGADFDPNGHATLWDADQGAFLGTLENPSNIGYHPATGAWRTLVAGWYRIPGVTAARRSPPIIIPPPNLVIPGNPYQVTDPAHQVGVGGAIRAFWDALGDRQFQVLGFPELNEQQAWVTELDETKRQRTVQRFERSYVIHQPEAPDGWRVVLALLNQKIVIIN